MYHFDNIQKTIDCLLNQEPCTESFIAIKLACDVFNNFITTFGVLSIN
jgi:hypothetical protein